MRKMNVIFVVVCSLFVLYGSIEKVGGITIKKVCPGDEAHKSCSFFEEYVCWLSDTRLERVKASPKRLAHCKSGCFCKKGYVRDFPGGGCIISAGCKNHRISAMLEKLPMNKGFYIVSK